jgi:hypothetical protein
VFHHEHDYERTVGHSHDTEPPCVKVGCPSLTPRKLVYPGYRVAVRAGRKP